MSTIREAWEQFVVLTLATDISDAQIEATRRAFYAGAAGLWGVFEQADATGEQPERVLRRVRWRCGEQSRSDAMAGPKKPRRRQ
ncbi:MAG: hypothetical protein WDO73_25310 [Ignavibacteriota bacterium]